MAGFWRSVYWLMGYEYIGKKEIEQINRQKHLKYLNCQQIKASNFKLKPTKKDFFINKILKKTQKKKR